jgi:hypothetical protein
MDVVRPAVQEHDRRAGDRANVRIADAQDAGVYAPQFAERRGARGLETFGANSTEPCSGSRDGGQAQELTAIVVDLFTHR